MLGQLSWVRVAVAASVLLLIGGMALELSSRATQIESARADLAEATAGHTQQLLDMAAKARKAEAALQTRVDDAAKTFESQRQAHARTAAGLRAERDRLRRDIAAYAAGGGGDASADSVAACRDRADTLGRLLDAALRAAEERTADAEDRAAEVRALLDAWPRN